MRLGFRATYFFQFLGIIAASLVLFMFAVPERQVKSGGRASLRQASAGSAYLRVLTGGSPRVVAPGATLVSVVGAERIELIDRAGNVLNSWPFDSIRARLLPNCNLLTIHGTSSFGKNRKPWADLRNVIREYDWNGELVWEYVSPRLVHHDVHRLKNGNTIFLERDEKRVRDSSPLAEARNNKLRFDIVKEVTPAGQVVFEWHSIDHLDTSYCGWQGCEGRHEERRFRKDLHDWTHANTLSILPENRLYDAGDTRFKPGNFLIMPRNFWTVLLVDRESGNIVWRYNGTEDDRLIRGHEPYMIPKGLPGAGNILLFDNGVAKLRHYSIAREILPASKRLTWSYVDTETFYSKAAGRVQRLPNGNTLISQDRAGRVFEVTPAKEIVWEVQANGFETSRATRYPPGYCPRLLS